jgi:hypothetical protein
MIRKINVGGKVSEEADLDVLLKPGHYTHILKSATKLAWVYSRVALRQVAPDVDDALEDVFRSYEHVKTTIYQAGSLARKLINA